MESITCFGEIVFDLFPGESRIGGAPFNAAYHLKQMNCPVRFISALGRDENGKVAQEFLRQHQLETAIHPELPTGVVEVHLSPNGGHQFHIVEGCAWEEINTPTNASKVLLFGSLALKSQHNKVILDQWLEHKPQWVLCDLNIRQPHFSKELAQFCLERCNALKINDDELLILRDYFNLSGTDKEAVKSLAELFSISSIALTLGPAGVSLFYANEWFHADAKPIPQFIDTVGAGDSFTSVFAKGLYEGADPAWILDKGTQLAAQICGQRGALGPDARFYDFVHNSP